MPKFILEIDLGNDAMRCNSDVAGALSKVSKDVVEIGIGMYGGHPIRDINGNVVGKYEVI